MKITFVEYNEKFLEKSWKWLNDPEIKKLTLTRDFTKQEQRIWYNSLKGKGDYLIWGVMSDDFLIGVCGLKNITDSYGEYWGYIGDKKFWGKGIGNQILSFILEKAIEKGLESIYLKVSELNTIAISLYSKFHFQKTQSFNGLVTMRRDIKND